MTPKQRQEEFLRLTASMEDTEMHKNAKIAKMLNVSIQTVLTWKSRPTTRHIPSAKFRLLKLLMRS
jgi:transposase